MGQAQMLIHIRLGVPDITDRERPTSVLPIGSNWGQQTTGAKGWLRVVVSDDTKTDQEVLDALVPFIEPPTPDGELDQQGGHKKRWRFMTDRLPASLSQAERDKLRNMPAKAHMYMLVAESAPGVAPAKRRAIIDKEVARGKADTDSEIVGLTFSEFLTCMVNKETEQDGNGNPVVGSRSLRA